MHTALALFMMTASLSVALVCPQSPSRAANRLLDGLPRVDFEWTPVQGISERGAIVVPIVLADATYKFQLDTGSDVTVFYGSKQAAQFGWKKGRKSVRVPGFNLAGTALPATWVQVQSERQVETGEAVGTIGLDILIGRVVMIDYRGKRLYVIPRADVPGNLWGRVEWTSAEIRNGKFFVHTKLNGAEIHDLFFDTGASGFSLIVDFERWKLITHRIDERDAPIQLTTNSWGKQVSLVGAPMVGPIEFGAVRFECPKAFYTGERPAYFRSLPFPASGALGNALFWDDIVVLDLSVSPQFGILR